MSLSKELVKAIRRAVSRIDKGGLDGEVPECEVKAVMAFGAGVEAGLRDAVCSAPPERLAATIRLVRLTRAGGLANEIAAQALRRAVPLEAKGEAIGLLCDVGVEIPQQVEDTLRAARQFVEAPDAKGLDSVLALPEAWKESVLCAWLVRSGSDASLLESVLGLDPRMDPIVVERLGASGNQEAVPTLRRLVAGEDRKLRKIAKRALHRLRAAGVDVAEATPARFSLQIAPDMQRESRTFATGIDGSGGRILWVMAPSIKGGYRLLEAVVDDQQGLRKSEVMSVALKEFRAHIERLRANSTLLIAQLELRQAVAILRAGEALAAAAGNDLPPEYEAWRDDTAAELFAASAGVPQGASVAVDPAREKTKEGGPEDPAGRFVPEQRELLAQSADLLGEPYFANWAVLGKAVESAAAGVRRAETSTLLVDEEQRKQQVDREIAGVAEVFDEATRMRYRQRLEQMTDVLRATKHEREAELALAAAQGFTDVADLYSDHPFARALIQRGVLAAYQSVRQEEDRESSESRIVQG